jgi:predicted phosphohydrolase
MQSKCFVLSDIHLEGKAQAEKLFIQQTLNKSLEAQRQQGIEPILVFPGDVHNGIQALEWMSEINARIIYTCGNHEFWKNDYYEVIEALKEQKYANIHFLHNDFVAMDGMLFVGGITWTDVGQSLNPDLLAHSTNTMNDNWYIKAKNWYDNPDNHERLKKIQPHHADKMIEEKCWNVLIELEENQQALNFFQQFSLVHEKLMKIADARSFLDRSLVSTSSYSKIDEATYQERLTALESWKDTDSFAQWLEKNRKNLHLHDDDITMEKEGSLLRDAIFNKLKHIDVHTHKLMMVSHHLPFLEERLVGRLDWVGTRFEQQVYNELKDELFIISQGDQYPYHNYFWLLSKGEFKKDENICQIVHYHNNGARTFPSYLIEKAQCWIHGHEHHYNYEDYVKGVKIVTNPFGYRMSVFHYNKEKEEFELNKNYVEKNDIKPEDYAREIEKIQNTFLRPVSNNLSADEKNSAAMLWILKHGQLDELSQQINHVSELNKKLLDYLLKNPRVQDNISDKQWFNLTLLLDSLKMNTDILEGMEKKLDCAYNIRMDEDFTFQQKHFNMGNHPMSDLLNRKRREYATIHRGAKPNMSWEYDMWIQFSFSNFYNREQQNQWVKDINQFIEKQDFHHFSEITSEMITSFNQLFDHHLSFNEMSDYRKTQHQAFTEYKQQFAHLISPEQEQERIRERNKKLDF